MVFNLDIVTTEKTAFSGKAKKLTVPSQQGQLTILSYHLPLFTTLKEGKIKVVDENNKTFVYQIGKGVLEVNHNNVNLLIEPPEHSQQMTLQRSQEGEIKAKTFDKSKLQASGAIHSKSAFRRSLLDFKDIKRRKKTLRFPTPTTEQ